MTLVEENHQFRRQARSATFRTASIFWWVLEQKPCNRSPAGAASNRLDDKEDFLLSSSPTSSKASFSAFPRSAVIDVVEGWSLPPSVALKEYPYNRATFQP